MIAEENEAAAQGAARKPFYKKWWFWLIVVLVVLAAASAGAAGQDQEKPVSGQGEASSISESGEGSPAVDSASDDLGDTVPDEASGDDASVDQSIPTEYKSALKKAQIYSDTMHMSKAGLYDQLTSEYGEQHLG